MKKRAFIACSLTISIPLLGLIGRCIDNSTHLKTRYDNKEYHFVECYCDCSDTLKECPRCGHKRMAQEKIIISTPQNALISTAKIKEKKEKHTTDPYVALAALVKSHKNNSPQ